MIVAVGCDHGGYLLKGELVAAIQALGHTVVDAGTGGPEPVDYPDFAAVVARSVAAGEADLGVLVCGTGIGMSIAANKVPGAYAARAHDCYSARMARLHNAANILTMGGRVIGPGLAREVLEAFLNTQPSEEERHQRRRQKVVGLEGG